MVIHYSNGPVISLICVFVQMRDFRSADYINTDERHNCICSSADTSVSHLRVVDGFSCFVEEVVIRNADLYRTKTGNKVHTLPGKDFAILIGKEGYYKIVVIEGVCGVVQFPQKVMDW